MKNIILVLFMSIISLASCQSNKQESNKTVNKVISSKEFKTLLSESTDYQLIDVRTKSEYAEGTIKDAINLDILDGTFEKALKNLKKEVPVFVFCAKGGRSGKAAKILNEKGFNMVYDLEGGYANWP